MTACGSSSRGPLEPSARRFLSHHTPPLPLGILTCALESQGHVCRFSTASFPRTHGADARCDFCPCTVLYAPYVCAICGLVGIITEVIPHQEVGKVSFFSNSDEDQNNITIDDANCFSEYLIFDYCYLPPIMHQTTPRSRHDRSRGEASQRDSSPRGRGAQDRLHPPGNAFRVQPGSDLFRCFVEIESRWDVHQRAAKVRNT